MILKDQAKMKDDQIATMDADIGNLKTLFNEKAVEIENIKNSFDKIREFYEKDAFKEPADEICNTNTNLLIPSLHFVQ